MLKEKRIGIIISGALPNPNNGASVILFYYYIKSLYELGAELYVLCINDRDYTDIEINEFIKDFPNLKYEFFRTKPPISSKYFFVSNESNKFHFLINGINSFAPELLLCFDMNASAIGELVNSKIKIAWLGDLNFETHWYHLIYSIKENIINCIQFPSLLIRVYKWKNLYNEVLKDFSGVVVSSFSSIQKLKELGISSVYLPYPWPSSSIEQKNTPQKPTFLFFGNLVGLGSRSALHMLVKKIYPLALKIWGVNGFCIKISGKSNFDSYIKSELKKCKEIEFVGFIDNLSIEMSKCHAVIAPIDVPVGNRSRILTAMSSGALLIAHKNASLGNPDLVNNINCLLCNDEYEFVDAMIKSVTMPLEMEAISKNGIEMFNLHFSIKSATNKFYEFLVNQLKK